MNSSIQAIGFLGLNQAAIGAANGIDVPSTGVSQALRDELLQRSFRALQELTAARFQVSGTFPCFSREEALRTLEGLPALDLQRMEPRHIRDYLFMRASHAAQAKLGIDRRDFSCIPNDLLRDLGFMAFADGGRLSEFLGELGWPESVWRDERLGSCEQSLSQDYADYERNVRDSVRSQTRGDQALSLAVYLEMALHIPSHVAQHLMVVDACREVLGLSWRDAVRLRDTVASDYEKNIRRRVQDEGGLVPFERYFEIAMYDPAHGVYTGPSAENLIGRNGFFNTSSECKAFGQLLARFLMTLWNKLRRPERFDVVEMGGGNGTLAFNILNEIQAQALRGEAPWESLWRAVRYRIVEVSPVLAEKQRKKLAAYGERSAVQVGSAVNGPLPRVEAGVFLSNELVDMFPPTKLIERAGRLYEVYVTSRGGLLQEVLMPLRPETQAFVDEHFILTAPGHAFYLQRDVDAWVRNIDRHLGDGYLLTVDYGARRPHLLHQISTGLRPRQLRGYGGRNSLANILGLPVPEALQYEYMHDPTALFLPKDLTIDVDFSTIDEAVHATKRMAQLVLKTQEDFFRSLLESEGGHEGLEDLDRFRRYGDHLVALHGRLTLRRQGATSNGHGV